ncbi:MAG TPA: hypothetical protein VF767_12655, partial [Bryobacteraceae bacterium]
MAEVEIPQDIAPVVDVAAEPAVPQDFDLLAFRLEFVARDSIYFPPGKSGNIVRGAFGTIFRQLLCAEKCHNARECEQRSTCPYARIFEPVAQPA